MGGRRVPAHWEGEGLCAEAAAGLAEAVTADGGRCTRDPQRGWGSDPVSTADHWVRACRAPLCP